MKTFSKTIPVLLCLITLTLVIFYQTPPDSFKDASLIHWTEFFIPLFLIIYFSVNLFLKFPLKSFLISISITSIFILKGLELLSLFNFLLITGAVFLIYKKLQKPSTNLFPQRRSRALKLKRQ